jgi:hypothetical protein
VFYFHVIHNLWKKCFFIMVTKCVDMHILLNLIGVTIVFACFDLWMSQGDVDTFALVIKLGNVWMLLLGCLRRMEKIGPLHGVTIAIFYWKTWFDSLCVAFVKNEGNNLTTMVTTLCSIVDCEPLNLQWFYEDTCFGWVLQKNTSRPWMRIRFLWV